MPGPKHSVPDLRVAPPTLEPEPGFVLRLAALANASGAAGEVALRAKQQAWRISLAMASVAVIAIGGAWLSGTFSSTDSPNPAPSPATHPSQPVTTSSNSRPVQAHSAGSDPSDGPDGGSTDASPEQAAPSVNAGTGPTGTQQEPGDQASNDQQGSGDSGSGSDHSGSGDSGSGSDHSGSGRDHSNPNSGSGDG